MAVVEIPDVGMAAVHEPSTRSRAVIRALKVALPAALVLLILLACFLGPLVLPIPSPVGGNILDSNLPPFSPGHLLGTDPNGNDIFARLLSGGRASLIVTFGVNAIGLVIGGTLGAVSGYLGGVVDTIIMRILDMFIAFPALVLILAVAQSLGPSLRNTILALAFFSIPAFARISRSATLRVREQPFMAAAQLCGTSRRRVLLRHIAPNVMPQLITFCMLGLGLVIVIAGALSFLGLGIPAPAPSWGNMISQGQASLSATPMLVVWPCVTLFVTVLGFNLLGEALRERWSEA